MQTHCNFCGENTTAIRKCPYEGLCFHGLSGRAIKTVPKLNFSDPTVSKKQEERKRKRYEEEEKATEKPKRGRPDIKCTAYNIYSQQIATFKSFNSASQALNIDISVINYNVNARRKNGITECGHAFRLIGAAKRECKIIVRLENGIETGRWPTVAAAARAVGKLKGWVYQQCEGLRRNRFNDPIRFEYKIIHI